MDGLVVDLFCGGGGASEGLRRGLGRDPDFAVNHNAEAIAMHEANHPGTRHFVGDVWHASPLEVTRGRRVDWFHMSPTCTHFSQAKGGPLRDPKERALAWVGIRWAREAKPRVWSCENVPAFESWGRLDSDGTRDPRYSGHTYKTFVGKLKALGYRVEAEKLRGCDYGAPTTRERLFMLARCDGERINWPMPTHGPGLLPFRSAGECMDWSVPARSIFDRAKPLALPTLRRIARAMHKHVLGDRPYLVPHLGAVATMVQTGYGEHEHQRPRALDIRAPLGTAVAGAVKVAVVFAVLIKNFGGPSNGGDGISVHSPLSTITCQDHHSLVQVVAARQVDTERVRQVREVLSLGDGERGQLRLGQRDGIYVNGERYEIGDIQLRMLEPRELATAQGFDRSYIIDPIVNGKRLSKTAQVRCIGNSVVPQVIEALVRANLQSTERRAA